MKLRQTEELSVPHRDKITPMSHQTCRRLHITHCHGFHQLTKTVGRYRTRVLNRVDNCLFSRTGGEEEEETVSTLSYIINLQENILEHEYNETYLNDEIKDLIEEKWKVMSHTNESY